ncbi:glycoside hydrolase family 31 protein [Edaphobacter paludis]|uniref:Glycoside hydrolase family 31 protein n=1 Tax=Edaphobacter paludis TaxID=3035702 RepID=A0AAU7CVR9_9BACT
MKTHLHALCAVAVLLCSGVAHASSPASTSSTSAGETPRNELVILDSVTQSRPLPNGIELTSGRAIMQITALRDDVIRVRVGLRGKLPEDASWAALKDARTQSVSVTPERDSTRVGFRTQVLRVQVELASMRLRITDLEGNVVQEDEPGRPVEFHGGAFRVYKAMPEDEHYFGLGDKVGPLDRRNQAFTMWNTNQYGFQESTDPIYKSIPFFLTFRRGRAAGVFLDNTWRSSFDFGKESHTAYSFGSEGGPLDYYVLYGPDPKHVLSSYAWLTGYTPLPPLWSLGYQQSRSSYYPESRVREIANRLRTDKIPADVIYLDIEYQQKYRPFTVDTEKFPHFSQMIADLKKEDFRVVAITDLHIADLPHAGYAPYDTGIAGDHFVKNPDGSIYTGQVWPGTSVFPDFTRASTRAWWGSLYRQFVADGIAGFWNDMNEPAIFGVSNKTMPDNVQHRIDEPGFTPRTANHLEIHNVYGMENSRATYDGLRTLAPDQRPFVLTRASYAGGQRYATTWTGDNSSTWNHLRLTTPMLLNLGLSGFAMSGADVGGFAGTPQPDLLTKWFELAAFQPIDRDHTSRTTADQEPWVNGPEQENIRRAYIEERYRLMPYLYTTAEEMSRTGLPIVRPLFLEFPDATKDKHPIDLDAGSEFLFGPDLLVAPQPYPDELDSYQVRLPPITWYDYWTGEKIEHRTSRSKPVVVHPTLSVLPVYVREGSILPMQPLTQSTMETPQGPLTLRVYPGNNCKGSLYLDDGISYAYSRGDFLRVDFHCEVTRQGVQLHIGKRRGSYPAWWKNLRVEIYGIDSEPQSIRVNGKPETLQSTSFDASRHCVDATLPDSGEAQDITIDAGNHSSQSTQAKPAQQVSHAGNTTEQPTDIVSEQ